MKIRSRAGWKGLFLFCLAASIASPAQEFKTLVDFDGDGSGPVAPVLQGLDGNLYSTTGGDTFFTVTEGGALTSLQFVAGSPSGALAQTVRGNFYGTTQDSGLGYGTVFKVTPAGAQTRLYQFCTQTNCADGADPRAGVILATDGNLYGTTASGGDGGTVFRITLQGVLATLYSFSCSLTACGDGDSPIGGLVQAADGNFCGTTLFGGTNSGCGTVFKITPGGALTTVHSFDGNDGSSPLGTLVQAPDGGLYGVTEFGGPSAGGCGDSQGSGTVFRITAAGALTTLYSFCALPNCADGLNPYAGLVRATDGNFYGTTQVGGANNLGTVFRITPGGVLTTLHSFSGPDGEIPDASLFQATDGILYGTASSGGTSNDGTVFSLSVGLGPFVETLPTSGAVGKTIDILSQGLTGTTAVSFNGTAASFTVVSDTYLTATIPSGATTGFVSVTTPSATLKSNLKFRVVP
jgi:uncharacterized repeat protein (TIGR03803 family)